MKSRMLLLGASLACGGDARTVLLPPPEGSTDMGGAAGQGGGSGAGGAAPAPTDAGVDAAPAAHAGSGGLAGSGGFAGGGGLEDTDGGTTPGGPIPITIDPESIVIFDLPINSTRFAAAGVDAASGVCASIIWDYSNNELEIGRHCDDFGTYPRFPYVLVRTPPESCDNLEGFWDYGGLEPEVASGCFDPVAQTVNVEIEVFSLPTFYRIIMNNEPRAASGARLY